MSLWGAIQPALAEASRLGSSEPPGAASRALRETGRLGERRGLGCLFGAKPLRTRTYLFPDEKVFPRSIKTQGLKIHQRFHFASALKRMSVLASYEKLGSTDLCYIAAVKGAPETLHSMVSGLALGEAGQEGWGSR